VIIVHARTPFAHHGFLQFNRQGSEIFVVVIKATCRVDENGSLSREIEQIPVAHVDKFWGDPGLSSIRYEADLAWRKPGVDLIVNGHAYSQKPAHQVTVEFVTRHFHKRLHVSGDRVWESGSATPSQPFTSIPLIYERAFGGFDMRDGSKQQSESANPVGTGFCAGNPPDDGMPLPNVEDPAQLIQQWQDRPTPVGFGFVGRGWQPRVSYAGTYDEAWRNQKFPLLPDNFDERHFLGAPEDQVLPDLTDPEPVVIRNMKADGSEMNFVIPPIKMPVHARWGHETRAFAADLDTVVIEPGLAQVILTWRTLLDMRRKPDQLREVFVGHLSPGEERAVLGGKRYIGPSTASWDKE
jgi:hypothetical protein